MDMDDLDGGEAPPAPPASVAAAFGGGGGMPKMSAGVMSMVANAASTLQRNGEKGEVRNADAEAVPFLLMEEILERLKMLNYEREMPGSFKPLTHTYFAIASGNPTEQFHYFCAICAWLMAMQRISWKPPSQMDDPNSAVSALFSQLQQIGAPTNYPPQKLKQGFGEHCCAVLKHLLDQIPLKFERATYTEELEYEEAAVDEDAEVDVDEMADEVGAADVEEDEYFGGGNGEGGGGEITKLTDSILDTTVDPAAWQVELERVTPMLKMQILSDPKEWRNRLVNTKSHQQTVASLAPETYAMLDRLSEDMERTLKAVRAAEQKLNQQCKDQVDDFAVKQDKLQEVQDEFNSKNEAISNLSNILRQVSDELASTKGRMDERGTSMTDTSPLIKIKSALSRLKDERKSMDVRIGVVTHTLVAKKLKHDQHTKNEAARPKNTHVAADDAGFDDDMED
jgi:estrogen-related receptor beta like 1